MEHFWEMQFNSELRFRPWFIYTAGHEAVILFFVLSGVVLAHQLRSFKFSEYPQFLLKRLLRIYPAYYAALGFSAALLIYVKHHPNPYLADFKLSPWFYIWSKTSFDSTLVWGSLTILYHCGDSLNLATWTLFYEMWLSLFMPVLCFGLVKLPLYFRMGLIILLLSLSWYWRLSLLDNSWYAILYYAWYFILGIVIYAYLINYKPGIVLFVLGFLFYFSNYLSFGLISNRIFNEALIGLGSSIIILAAIHQKNFSKLLNYAFIKFYGKISYSIYLWHLPLSYALVYLWVGKINLFQIFLASIVLTTILSSISYYWLEKPGIKLAKKVLIK